MSVRRAAGWLLTSALPLATACAVEAGSGFSSLEPGELHAAYEPEAARDLGEGQLLTDRGYRVQLQELKLQLGEFALVEAGEVQASFAEVVHVAIDRDVDLLRGEEIELAPYEPTQELGAGTIDRAELSLGQLFLSAVVEGGQLDEPHEFETTVQVEQPVVTAPLALRLGRDLPEHMTPEAELRVGATLFDGIDFGDSGADENLVEARLLDWAAEAKLVVDLGVVGEPAAEVGEDDHDDDHDHE